MLAGPTLEAARALVGAHLIRDDTQRRIARIVEVEAYIGEKDLASHARFGRTGRNAVMYGMPGTAYVYLVYGMYDCLNVVTESEGRPAAVLIRAVEALDEPSIEAMRAARVAWWNRRHDGALPAQVARERLRIAELPDARLGSGPGLVAAAFDITRSLTGLDLLDASSSLRIEAGTPPRRVVATPRIGIAYASEPWRSHPWRFLDPDSGAISGAGPRGSAS